MSKDITKIWNDDNARQLAGVLTVIGDRETMQNFLRDVMTDKEIAETGARLEAARMLKNGDRYADITSKTKLSSRTVARISDWLKNGSSGYDAALKAIKAHHSHTPPASAE